MKLTAKFITVFIGILLMASIIGMIFVTSFTKSLLESQTKHHLEDVAFHTMDKIDRFMRERLVTIRIIAADPALRDRHATTRALTERLISFHDQHNSFISLSFFDLDRVRIADSAGLGLGEQEPRENFWPALENGPEEALAIAFSRSLGRNVVYFAARVNGDNGDPLGFVVARMSIERLNEIPANAAGIHADEKTVDVDLVNQDGLILYSSHAPGKILRDQFPDWEQLRTRLAPVKKIGVIHALLPSMAGHETEPLYIAFAGASGVPGNNGDGDWTLLLHVPARTVMQPTLDQQKQLLAILAMLILLAVPLIVYFSHTLLGPLRKLNKAMRQVGEGNYADTIEISTRDEIGELAQTFKAMLAVIKYAREKLRNRAEELETLVAARTAALRDALLTAEAANRVKADFLGNISHEMVTPLNATIGFAELLREEIPGSLNDAQKKCVGNIVEGGNRLLQITNAIIDMTRIEAGELTLQPRYFSVKELLDDVIGMTREKALTRGITVSLAVEPEADIEIEADEKRLKQIMSNIIGNAIKFNKDGGTAHVAARLGPAGEEPVIEIAVTDTGIGISAEDLQLLFKPFKQMEPSLTKKFSGIGLGLAVTKRLVELHGGRLSCESELGQGSTFTVTLPLRQPLPPAPGLTQEAA